METIKQQVRFSVEPARDAGRFAVVMDYQSHLALTAVGGRAVRLADGDYPTRHAAQQAADEITALVIDGTGAVERTDLADKVADGMAALKAEREDVSGHRRDGKPLSPRYDEDGNEYAPSHSHKGFWTRITAQGDQGVYRLTDTGELEQVATWELEALERLQTQGH